jgi:hypothetical protein
LTRFTLAPKRWLTFDSEPTHSIGQQRSGWLAILNNFARHVEAAGLTCKELPTRDTLQDVMPAYHTLMCRNIVRLAS